MNNTPSLHEIDQTLLAELAKRNSHHTGAVFQNKTIADIARTHYTAHQLNDVESLLQKNGTFSITITNNLSVSIDNKTRPISIVNATDISDSHHGEMSYMIYLRDQVQVASAYMKLFLLSPNHYQMHGKKAHSLIISALHLLSTPKQLARFDTVIALGNDATQEDWPHISLFTNDLRAAQPNGWRNKQDTFQMLAFLVLDAVEHRFLTIDELLPSHKAFLSKIVPLLRAVDFPYYESSGSWEEVAAKRTSVTAIEVALLNKIRAASDALAFLYQPADKGTFQKEVDSLIHQGLLMIGNQLPNESPDYNKGSIKYREADAALAYILYYDLAPLLAQQTIPITNQHIVMTEQQIEALVLKQLETLIDPITTGIARYSDDSYQRVNFHTNETQQIIKQIKQQINDEAINQPPDIDKKQRLRHELTPKGRVAYWTHPLGQIASWAALKSIYSEDSTDKQRYITISTMFVNRLLSTVTGEHTWSTSLTDKGTYSLAPIPAHKLPECYITYQTDANEEIVVASPHTPLHWSNAMAEESIALLKVALKKK